MTREEFERQKADSARRIREMYKGHNMPPYPDFVSLPQAADTPPPGETRRKAEVPAQPHRKAETPKGVLAPIKSGPLSLLGNLNIRGLTQNPDSLLILGLILLLAGENADEKLLLALIFIML